jgi:hypothetical protein
MQPIRAAYSAGVSLSGSMTGRTGGMISPSG